MKRIISLVLALCGTVICSFGIDLSVGGGISYSPITSKLIVSDIGGEGTASDHFNFGAVGAYLDATYVQAILTYNMRLSGSYESTGAFTGSGEYTNKETYLGISVLLKYPFVFETFSLFPLLGLESDLNLSYTDKNGNDLKSGLTTAELEHLNKYFIKVGAGADVNLGKRVYLRPVFVFGYKLQSRLDKDTVDYFMSTYGLNDVGLSTIKIDFVFLVGYRL